MTVPAPTICCPNRDCSAPLNEFGRAECANCQTPLTYRFLWAIGEAVLNLPVGSMIDGRYFVKSPQIWLDTQPAASPDFPQVELPDEMQVYLYLYPYRLHVPEVFGVCTPKDEKEGEHAAIAPILLLENVPLDAKGYLLPSLHQIWDNATATRQVHWLWQLLQLWEPLAQHGVSASLLVAENLRVDGWRVRLCQLFWDDGLVEADNPTASLPALNLGDLANVWAPWIERANPNIVEPLQALAARMHEPNVEVGAIAHSLNQLMLQQAAQLPLYLHAAGATDAGPQHSHNEDSCYPLTAAGPSDADGIFPHLAIVCDGIGGHEGGEVASQLAVQSLKPQIQALLAEVATTEEPLTPAIVAEQLAAVVRVINDLIAGQNDTQGRADRRRMGTTLVMAVQLPQPIAQGEQVAPNSHELYLVNVGDSRAYWLTPRACHLLTVDDDVAVREVRMGRMLYREALQRADAGALIQALGTRDAEFIHPTIQRFILDEDGILLLCSDGLSDNDQVEAGWQEVMTDVFRGRRSLEAAAQDWIDLANQKNGRDNVSVVLLQCRVSSAHPPLSLPETEPEQSDWSDSSRALLEAEPTPTATEAASSATDTAPPRRTWGRVLLILALLLIGGLAVWAQFHPTGLFQWETPEQPER